MLKDLVERAIEKAGTTTALGEVIGCTQGFVSHMRTGRRSVPPEIAVKLAEYLGERSTDYIIPALLESAKTPEQKKIWTKELLKFRRVIETSGAAAALLLSIALIPHSNEAPAKAGVSACPTGDFSCVQATCHCRTHLISLIILYFLRFYYSGLRIVGRAVKIRKPYLRYVETNRLKTVWRARESFVPGDVAAPASFAA